MLCSSSSSNGCKFHEFTDRTFFPSKYSVLVILLDITVVVPSKFNWQRPQYWMTILTRSLGVLPTVGRLRFWTYNVYILEGATYSRDQVHYRNRSRIWGDGGRFTKFTVNSKDFFPILKIHGKFQIFKIPPLILNIFANKRGHHMQPLPYIM
jgi:hypothetical protein